MRCASESAAVAVVAVLLVVELTPFAVAAFDERWPIFDSGWVQIGWSLVSLSPNETVCSSL